MPYIEPSHATCKITAANGQSYSVKQTFIEKQIIEITSWKRENR